MTEQPTLQLSALEIDALLREARPTVPGLDDQLTIEMIQLSEEVAEDQIEDEVEDEADDEIDEPEDLSPTLELLAVIPEEPSEGGRLAHGSDAVPQPNLTRRYQRTQLFVIDILRGLCDVKAP